jgi:sulfoacetaldehyde acetyltransferase
LDRNVSYAGIAKACGVEGVQVWSMDELTETLKSAVKAQMEDGKTTFIEVMTNMELGEPFRRDAMKKPEIVAGINIEDMCPQKGA